MSSSEKVLEEFKRALIEVEVEEAARGFLAHLTAYVTVNAFLVFINLYTHPEYLWFVWPLFGWGIGLAFHFISTRKRFVTSACEKKSPS